jgi:hypothetical protein
MDANIVLPAAVSALRDNKPGSAQSVREIRISYSFFG